MDILYLYRHSAANDFEIRYSLRSVEQYLPYIRKVWIFGDRPHFLADDVSIVEHVRHDYVARIANYRLPVRNIFLLTFLASLIPRLDHEFLIFCDDYFLLDHVSETEIRKDRVLEDLETMTTRGRGLWKDSLWRTYDLLKRFGYPVYNFETHCPNYMTKSRVLEAYSEFRDFITEDFYYGPVAFTAIQNHALRHGQADLELMAETNPRAGFYRPTVYEAIAAQCQGKKFLSFDDGGFNDQMRRYLHDRFPRFSRFERNEARCDWTSGLPGVFNDLLKQSS